VTTIATDGRVMAADGRTVGNGTILNDRSKKLYRLPDGSIVGGAGDADFLPKAVEELARSIRDEEEPALVKGDYALIRLMPKGQLLYYYEKLLPTVVFAPFAIGSGSAFAEGAMLAGKHPVDAVKIATLRDTGTGGRIHTLKPRPA
jgi:ATP-dependent protease HslVU (ClpYQ) peptidase subunit